MIHLLPLPFLPLIFSPFAAADDEWMNVDQQGECLRRSRVFALPTFICSASGTRAAGKVLGGVSLLTFFCTIKESKAASGAATPASTEIDCLVAGRARQAPSVCPSPRCAR